MIRNFDSISVKVLQAERADKVLSSALIEVNPFLSRQIIDEWFEEKCFSLRGRILRPSDYIDRGDWKIQVSEPASLLIPITELQPPADSSKWVAEAGEMVAANLSADLHKNLARVVFDHPDFFILYKPSGVPSVPLVPWEEISAVQLGLEFFPDWAAAFPRASLELGLVHRLDEGTSGLILCAKSVSALEELRGLFRTGEISKVYLAWSFHRIDSDPPLTITEPLVALKKTARRISLARDVPESAWRGKPLPAVTKIFFVQKRTESEVEFLFRKNLSRMPAVDDQSVYEYEIQILTGVRHQIRVHMLSLGAPLVGDFYGDAGGDVDLEHSSQELADKPSHRTAKRLGLHAHRLEFLWRGQKISVRV